jgi:hypothetical protein
MLGGPAGTTPTFWTTLKCAKNILKIKKSKNSRWAGGYNPYFLDDPEMRISKDRTVIKQEGYVVSCIPYVKKKIQETVKKLTVTKNCQVRGVLYSLRQAQGHERGAQRALSCQTR